MSAPVWIDGIGALSDVCDDPGQEVAVGSGLVFADEKGA
jgi:hypothetical protein